MQDNPFGNIESAQVYVTLLLDSVEDTRKEIRKDIDAAAASSLNRQLDALRLVDHQMNLLTVHLRATSRILNDLRMLRRLLLAESEE